MRPKLRAYVKTYADAFTNIVHRTTLSCLRSEASQSRPTKVYPIHNDDTSDALADDQHVCPTAQPFRPELEHSQHTHLKRMSL